MANARTFQISALIAALAVPALSLRALAADTWDLFPTVPLYDEAIASPVTHPEKTLGKPRILVPPGATTSPASETPAATTATAPATTGKAPDLIAAAKARLSWTIDRATVLTPFLTPDEQATFDKDFTPMIRKALSGTPDERRKASDDLSGAADKDGISPGLRRYLMLEAAGLMIRAAAPFDDRRVKAQRVMPMLEEKTLAIGQARVDCLHYLCQSINNAPPKILESMVDSHLALARYQIQSNFGSTAVESMNLARKLILQLRDQPPERMDQLAETQAYVDYGSMALAAWPRWQTVLKTKPADPGANTFVAACHIAIYQDLERAAPYAAKSGKKEMQDLAAALEKAKLSELSANPARIPEATLALSAALLDVAKSSTVPFEEFSAASLAIDKLTALTQVYPRLPPAQADKARALIASANQVIEKTAIRPIRVAASQPKPETATTAKAIKTYAAVGAMFKDAPKTIFPDAGSTWSPDKTAEADKWLKANMVGQILTIRANLQRVGAPVEKPDGSVYVPAAFTIPRVDINDTIASVSLDAKFTGKSVTVIRQLPIGQDAAVAGYITAIEFRGGMSPSVHITLIDQVPKE